MVHRICSPKCKPKEDVGLIDNWTFKQCLTRTSLQIHLSVWGTHLNPLSLSKGSFKHLYSLIIQAFLSEIWTQPNIVKYCLHIYTENFVLNIYQDHDEADTIQFIEDLLPLLEHSEFIHKYSWFLSRYYEVNRCHVQGVPRMSFHVVLVVFSASCTHTEDYFTTIQ